jgi:hypothetical protein
MTPTVQSNVRQFNAAFLRYMEVTSRTPAEAVLKQSQEFAYALRRRLQTLAPLKGAVRAQRLAALASGGGLRIRPAVRDFVKKNTTATLSDIATRREGSFMETTKRGRLKKNGRSWWQLAVDKELGMRERGRGFVAYSSRFSGMSKMAAGRGKQRQQVLDRYKRFLSAVGVTVNPNDASAVFAWGGNRSSGEVAKVLKQGKGQQAVADALGDARDNMMVYVRRKLAANAAQTVGRVR